MDSLVVLADKCFAQFIHKSTWGKLLNLLVSILPELDWEMSKEGEKPDELILRWASQPKFAENCYHSVHKVHPL